MLEINYSLFVQIANFLFLLFILNILLYRPIRKVLSRRNDEMNSFQNLIEDYQDRFARDEKDLKNNMIEARKEGFKEKEAFKGEGLEEEKGILKEATTSAEEKIGKARDEMQENLVNVRQSLQSEVEGFSKELAEKILGRSI